MKLYLAGSRVLRHFSSALLVSVLSVSNVAWGGQHSHKASADSIAAASKQDSIRVLVQWNVATGPATQALITGLGGGVLREFKIIKAGNYDIPSAALSQLESNSDVKYVSVDREIHHKLDYTAAAVNAGAARGAGWIGSGIGVAVIDSGINNDANIANVVYTQDFTGAKGKNVGQDEFGHGQHVAGIIASTGATTAANTNKAFFSRNFFGVAPGANLVNLRVLDSTGSGSDSNVIAAIETAIQLKNTYHIRVINLSLGRPVSESFMLDPLCQAVEAAWKAGIVVVVAAGNDGRDNSAGTFGYGTITAPGNDPYVITVGAMKTEMTYDRSDDLMASYSSKGPTQIDHIVKPDLVAPGNRVVSLLAKGSTLASKNSGNLVLNSYYQIMSGGQAKNTSQNFLSLSGTSMAAPVVSGAAADLLQLNPSLTPDQIKILLMQTAYKTFPTSSFVVEPTSGEIFTTYYDVFAVGAGYLDLGAAIASVDQVPTSGTALSPVANYDPNTGNVAIAFDTTTAFANQSVWGSKAVWGTKAVWGSAVLDTANKAVWGTKAVWGSTSPLAQKAVWGSDSIFAATTATLSESTINLTGEN